MYKYPTWKYILVVMVLAYAVIYSLPNFYNTYPSIVVKSYDNKELTEDNLLTLSENSSLVYKGINNNNIFFESIDDQLSAYNKLIESKSYSYTLSNYNHIPKWLYSINAQPISLGLDLKGGVHFLLQIDNQNVKRSRLNKLESNLRNFFIDNGIRYDSTSSESNKVTFRLNETSIDPEIMQALRDNFSDYEISNTKKDQYTIVVANLSKESMIKDVKAAMQKNLTILRSRVNELGVSQPIIQRQGKDRIIVQLPGLQDSTRAKNILGSTATLEFR